MPKNLPGAHPMRRVTIRISEKDWSCIRFMAYAYGRTPSSVARGAIQEYMAIHYEAASQRATSLFENRRDEEQDEGGN
jgi:hypothetical protein